MRILTTLSFFVLALNCFAQLGLDMNYEEILQDEKLKNIKTMYYRVEDTSNSDGRLLFSKAFSEDGKVTEKYVYTFWDVVSYDHTTSYKYDKNWNLIEEITIQRILNLGKRDEEYINALGADPINEKINYEYNEYGFLTKKNEYSFGEEGFLINQKPSRTVIYEYKDSLLINEKSFTPNGRVTYENYEMTCKYKKEGQQTKKIKKFSDGSNETITFTL